MFEVTNFSTVEASIFSTSCVDVHCLSSTSEGSTHSSPFILRRESGLCSVRGFAHRLSGERIEGASIALLTKLAVSLLMVSTDAKDYCLVCVIIGGRVLGSDDL